MSKIARIAVNNMMKMNTKPVKYTNKGFAGNKPTKKEDTPSDLVFKYTMMIKELRKKGEE